MDEPLSGQIDIFSQLNQEVEEDGNGNKQGENSAQGLPVQ